MAATENMNVRVSEGTLKTIKKFSHDNGVSMRVVIDGLAEFINIGYIKIEGNSIRLDNPYKEFEKAVKAVGKDPIVVITSVTEQLRRK